MCRTHRRPELAERYRLGGAANDLHQGGKGAGGHGHCSLVCLSRGGNGAQSLILVRPPTSEGLAASVGGSAAYLCAKKRRIWITVALAPARATSKLGAKQLPHQFRTRNDSN